MDEGEHGNLARVVFVATHTHNMKKTGGKERERERREERGREEERETETLMRIPLGPVWKGERETTTAAATPITAHSLRVCIELRHLCTFGRRRRTSHHTSVS